MPEQVEWRSAHSNPPRAIRTASTRSCPGFVAHPERCIIQRNDGLIQVIRSHLKGATKVPASSAASAISGLYAWYTVIVSSSNSARTRRSGTPASAIALGRRHLHDLHVAVLGEVAAADDERHR
jgi:hypothetical protein